jgi:quinol monooxygenase YgiN
MLGMLFRVEAKPGKYQELVDFLTWDAEVCRDEEPGTLRFEFYQDPENANALFVYEAYQDQEARAVHSNNEPLKHWRSAGLSDALTTNGIQMLFNGYALFSPTDKPG